MKGVRRYYYLWQKKSNQLVRKTMQENQIEIYHLLTYGNALWPASSYGMKQKFLWGPIGGLESVSAECVKDYSFKVRGIEWVRRSVVYTSIFNIPFRKRCKKAQLILCKSENVKKRIPLKNQKKAIVFTDVAAEPQIQCPTSKEKCVKFFAAGRMDGWRGFNLLLCAFREALKEHENMSLEIAGEGVAFQDIKELVEPLQGKVRLLGNISKEEYYEKMKACDVVVNPSLREGGVTTAFDTISLGKPLICIDTKGYTKNFSKEYAIIIEQESREKIEDNLRRAILTLTDEHRRTEMGSYAYAASKKLSWEKKKQQICDVIEKMV